MADEPKKDGPYYPPTTRLPKVEVPQNTLDAVLTEVRAMRVESTERFDKLETTVDTLVEDKQAVNIRLTGIERRIDRVEERGSAHSGGVRQLSETDGKHDAAIAMVITKVDRLEESQGKQTTKLNDLDTKVDLALKTLTKIATSLTGFFNDPKVKLVGRVVFMSAMTYAAARGLLPKGTLP